MVSINTPNCNSPRPPISKESLPPLSANVIATLVSASAKSLSRMTVDVTFLPSRPAKGESFTMIVTDMVGGSIGVASNGVVTSGEQIVSATDVLAKPAMQMMSPARTLSTGIRDAPSNLRSLVKRPVSITLPSRFKPRTLSLTEALPCATRPTRQRPR